MPIRVVELFAGVGGFRVGLEGYPSRENANYQVVWSNQWEPSTKTQHANLVYKNRWPNAVHSEEDIEQVIQEDFEQIPDHDLLVGGFPCQDYSVATTLKNSKGLIGKKGVLWWSIEAILRRKENKPNYLILENVDRLLKSPSTQRGRDFAVILASLNNLGYAVEWRVINAAEYGMPQRRRRVFIMAYLEGTTIYNQILNTERKLEWIETEGLFANAFPIRETTENFNSRQLADDLVKVTNDFNKGMAKSPFQNSGVMINGNFFTVKTMPHYNGEYASIKDILIDSKDVPKEFFVDHNDLIKEKGWKYLKGAKNESRYNASKDFYYKYAEGSMVFPDDINKPSRTIITGEGGPSPSRFKHVIEQDGKLRRLTPLELERLNMFPDNHTEQDGITDSKRAFFMGNALVVGIVEKLGQELLNRIPIEQNQEELV